MSRFRNGQWVKFKDPVLDNKVPGAHITGDGFHLGIFQRGTVDALGQVGVDRIMVCDPTGHNVPVIKDGAMVNLSIDPAEAAELHACDDVAHIPEMRRKTMHPDYVLKP